MADNIWADFDNEPAKAKAPAAPDAIWDDFDNPAKAKPHATTHPLGHVTPTAPKPGVMQRVGDAIVNFIGPTPEAPTLNDLVTGAAPKQHVGAIDSYTRGVLGALHRTAGTVNLLGLPVAGLVDSVHGLIAGQPQTGAQDSYARHMIDPEFHAAQQYDVQPHETQGFGGKVAGAAGALAPDLLAMLATGGESAELGAVVKPVVERNVAQNIAHGVGQAVEHSAKASLVPGFKAGVEQAQQHDHAGVAALGDVLGGYEQTAATNALPLAASARPGAGLVEQILTKGAQGAVAMPAVSGTAATLTGQPYSLEQAGVDSVLGSVMAQMGGGEHAPVGAPVDAPHDAVADRAARAQDALTRNAAVLGHGPDGVPPELLQAAAAVLGHPESAQPAAATARLDETPAAQPLPVPAEAPPTPTPAEPAGQSDFAQQAAAAMRMRAQAEAARATKTTRPEDSASVQPAAERAGSTPAAGDLHSDPLAALTNAQQALSAERAKPQRDRARIAELNADVERAQTDALKPSDDTPPPRMDIRYGKKRTTVSSEELAAREVPHEPEAEQADASRPPIEPAHADAEELTDADLSDSERASIDRLRVDRGGIRAKLSRDNGEADAHGLKLREAVDAAVGHAGIKVEYLRGQEGLPEKTRRQLQDQTRARGSEQRTSGLYVPGDPPRVFLDTGVVNTPEKAAFTAAHEIAGHHGLRSLAAKDAKVGNRTPHEALNHALEVALQNPTVAAVADSMMRRRSSTDRLRMAEEALADLAAASRTGQYGEIERRHGVTVPHTQRATLRGAVARFVERVKAVLGASGGKFTDAQVHDLLENAWQAAKESKVEAADDAPLESTEDTADFAPHAGDAPHVGTVADLPARRPGEPQDAFTRRINNVGGEELRTLAAETAKIKSITRANFKAMLAKQARMGDVADAVFHEYRKLFDSANKAATLRSIDQWETGGTVHDPDARNFFKVMDGMFADRIERLRKAKPEALKDLVENYFPHLWEDSSKATKWYQSNTKRPLDGNKSFLKQRTWGTIREGMESGLKPVSYNPVDLALLKLQQMDKFITFHEFKNDLQARGWLKQVKAGDKLPEGYATIDSPAFKGSHAFIIKGENGAKDEAASAHWNWAAPESIAADVNNYLSPSLYRFRAWKSLRYVQNVLMSTRLGFSAFHAGFTTTDNLVMHVDVAGRRLLTGDIAGGLQLLVKAPLTTILSPYEGGVLNKAWRGEHATDPHTAALLTALEEGGATRLQGAQQMDFNNALPGLIRSIRQKSASGALKRVLPAIGEASSYLIHQKLVPAQKMAARVMLLKFELDRLAGKLGKDRGDYAGIIEAMHPDSLKQISGKVVNLVDDRLGQMNYDNQFWNKTAREVAQGLIGAVGWQVGTLRTVTGGIADVRHLWKPEALVAPLDKAGSLAGDLGRVSGRLTYLLSLGMTMGGTAALTQYLLTGQGPDELKDYFFPKTGRKNPDGSAERLQFPSYWMDHYKLATHPLRTMEHKIHPSIGLLMEAINNQDYWGVQLRDEDAPWYEQAAQIGEHIAKGFVPYSLTGQQKLADSDASIGQRAANFVGVTTAPTTVSRSRFQSFVSEKAAASAPKGGRTQDQADHSDAMHDIEDALRRGESPDMSGLSAKEQKAARKAAELPVPALRFKRLSLEDKLRAWDMATPEERTTYKLAALIVGGKAGALDEAIAKLPVEDQEAVRAKITEIRMGPAEGYPAE